MWARSLVMTAAMTRSAAPLAKSALAICSIIRPGRPLGHADGDRALADDLDVAALQRRLAEVLESEPLVIAELRIPVLEGLVLEARVGAVDRGHVVGLAPAGGPVHRVDRDAAVDPARRVAREQAVRQRRQDEQRLVVDGGRDERRLPQPAEVEPRLGDGQAADEVARERVGRERRQAGLDVLDEARPDDGLRRHERDDPARGPPRWRPAPRSSRSWTYSTSTPRSRIRATNWSCSHCARSTHRTSSNSSSSWLPGVSRLRLRSGRWTMTWRSLPTSECTPSDVMPWVPP